MKIIISGTFEMCDDIDTDDYPDVDWSFFDSEDENTWPGMFWDFFDSKTSSLIDWKVYKS